jgi:hypothetical protein
MTFPIPPQIWAERPITSIWTDFTNTYDGTTLIGSYPVGAFMADWTKETSGDPNIFRVDTVAGSISGQAFHHRGTNTGSVGMTKPYTWNAIGTVADAEILIGFRCTSTTANYGLMGSGMLRYNVTSPGRSIRGELLGGAHDVRRLIASIDASIALDLTLTQAWPFNEWAWMRLQAIGTGRKLKIWRRADPEPDAWDLEGISAEPSVAGKVGISAAIFEISETYFDFFSVSTDGTPAYGPGL